MYNGYYCFFIDDKPTKLHDGRVRSFPHVRGNWASYVFIPMLLSKETIICLEHFATFLQQHFRFVGSKPFYKGISDSALGYIWESEGE